MVIVITYLPTLYNYGLIGEITMVYKRSKVKIFSNLHILTTEGNLCRTKDTQFCYVVGKPVSNPELDVKRH